MFEHGSPAHATPVLLMRMCLKAQNEKVSCTVQKQPTDFYSLRIIVFTVLL